MSCLQESGIGNRKGTKGMIIYYACLRSDNLHASDSFVNVFIIEVQIMPVNCITERTVFNMMN